VRERSTKGIAGECARISGGEQGRHIGITVWSLANCNFSSSATPDDLIHHTISVDDARGPFLPFDARALSPAEATAMSRVAMTF
jgi:hypothetical protein